MKELLITAIVFAVFSCREPEINPDDNSALNDSTANKDSIINKPVDSALLNLHFGKYYHSNGFGGALEFKNNDVLTLSGPSGSVDGSYKMTSLREAEISLGGYGDGTFSKDFQDFENTQGTWSKE